MSAVETLCAMGDTSRRRANLENQLDDLREQLLVADAAYENAITEARRDDADQECQRLRKQLRALREDLRNLNVERGGLRSGVRTKAQTAGE